MSTSPSLNAGSNVSNFTREGDNTIDFKTPEPSPNPSRQSAFSTGRGSRARTPSLVPNAMKEAATLAASCVDDCCKVTEAPLGERPASQWLQDIRQKTDKALRSLDLAEEFDPNFEQVKHLLMKRYGRSEADTQTAMYRLKGKGRK